MSLYFEEMNVGDAWVSDRRTITETDIVMFGSLTGDQHPMHFDEEFCKKNSPFKTRIAHGLLGMTYALGLLSRQDVMTTTGVAFLGYNSWKFLGPIKVGDTIKGRLSVVDKKDSGKGPGGVATFKMEVINQDDAVVQVGEYAVMVLRKPAS